MARAKRLSLAQQVERQGQDLAYLRSGIGSLLAVSVSVPEAMKPAVRDQLQEMLNYVTHEEDGT